MPRSKNIAATVATLSAMVAAIAFAAPDAGATVSSLRVERGLSSGSSETARGVGCSYSLIAKTEPGNELVFLDEVDAGFAHEPFQPAVVTADASGTARTTWTPTKRGQHHLWVVERVSEEEGNGYSTNPLTVGTGFNVGPACVVLP